MLLLTEIMQNALSIPRNFASIMYFLSDGWLQNAKPIPSCLLYNSGTSQSHFWIAIAKP